MNRPRHATLKSCVQQGKEWIATDTTGRRFTAETKAEAVKMCEDYNKPRKK